MLRPLIEQHPCPAPRRRLSFYEACAALAEAADCRSCHALLPILAVRLVHAPPRCVKRSGLVSAGFRDHSDCCSTNCLVSSARFATTACMLAQTSTSIGARPRGTYGQAGLGRAVDLAQRGLDAIDYVRVAPSIASCASPQNASTPCEFAVRAQRSDRRISSFPVVRRDASDSPRMCHPSRPI